MYILALLFRLLPQNLLSYVTGVLARWEPPLGFSETLTKAFVRIFRIDMSEAEKPLSEYRTIEDVFTRRLRAGSRKIENPVCSPADGTLSISAPCRSDMAIQAKELHYSLDELVFGLASGRQTHAKWYSTIYLAPHNYHRVHCPISGQLRRIYYFSGELWPVNQPFIRIVPRVFTRNERLVFEIEHETGGKVWVVMVGSFNVGRMSAAALERFASNDAARQLGPKDEIFELTPVPVQVGDELGVFMLGSTVVLVFDDTFVSNFNLLHCNQSRPILMGETLSVTL